MQLNYTVTRQVVHGALTALKLTKLEYHMLKKIEAHLIISLYDIGLKTLQLYTGI